MQSESLLPQTPAKTLPSLEDLLAVRSHHGTQAQATHPPSQSEAAPAKADVLLALTSNASSSLLLAWGQRVLDGQQPQAARANDVLAQVQALRPKAILIEFDPSALDAAAALAAELQASNPDGARIAIGRTQHPECMLAALRAGVNDFIDIDSPIATGQQILRSVLQRRQQVEARSQQPHAPQLAIISARAGLGCSVLASHLAWYLQQALATWYLQHSAAGTAQHTYDDQALACLLVEAGGSGGSGGDCAIYLNTPGDFSLSDAITQQHRLDRRMAQTALARHDSGLRLLPQPRQTEAFAPGEARALIARLGQYFSHIVFDLGAHTPPLLQTDLLAQASDIWVVCDQNVVSVVWTMALLSQLEEWQIGRERLRLIVNRHDKRLALDAQQIASRLQLPLLATLPERRRELADAVNHGKLLTPAQKSEPYVQAIHGLVTLLLHEHHPAAHPHQTPAGPLTQLLQRIRRS